MTHNISSIGVEYVFHKILLQHNHDILFGAQFSAHLFAVIRFGVQKSLFTIMALFFACELPNLQILNQNFLEAAMAKQVQVFGGTI